MNVKRTAFLASFVALLQFSSSSYAAVTMAITEWMYNGLGVNSLGEYVEFTNMTGAPIDMNNWSFDDSSRTADSQVLSAFGIVQPGESVIFTDDTAVNFRTNWNLPVSVKVIGGNANNLGRSDEVNLYDASDALVDRLTYNDQATPTALGPRTNGTAGGPASDSVLGLNDATQWSLLTTTGAAGDPHSVGVLTSLLSEKGNPGAYVPEPTAALALAGAAMLILKRRRV